MHCYRRPRAAMMAAALALACGVALDATAQEWTRTLGPAYGLQAVATQDGGFVVAGGVDVASAPFGGSADALLLKMTASGDVEWSTAFGGPKLDQFSGVALLADGYLAAGYVEQPNSTMNYVIVAFDLAGNVRWQRDYGFGGNGLYGFLPSSDGAFFFAYDTTSPRYPQLINTVVKLAADGTVIWHRGIDPYAPRCEGWGFGAITPTASGGVLLAVNNCIPGPDRIPARLVELDAAGDIAWAREYGTDPDRYALLDAIQLADGSFVVAGGIGPRPDGGGHRPGEDAWVMRTDSSGVPLWQRRFGTAEGEWALNLVATADGGVIASGYVLEASQPFHWYAKLDATGTLIESPEVSVFGWGVTTIPSGLLAVGFDVLTSEGAVARLDPTGRTTAPCTIVRDASLTMFAPPTESHEVTLRQEVLPTVPFASSYASMPFTVEGACTPTGCPRLTCGTIQANPSSPCAGELVTLNLDVSGGLPPVIVTWDLDGDGSADRSGNPVTAPAPAGAWTIEATARDACAGGGQTCRQSITLPSSSFACGSISAIPADPCPGELVMLTLDVIGGSGGVTVTWDLDGDTSTDRLGNPVGAPAPSGPWRIAATATDSCPGGPRTCTGSLVVPIPSALGEVSDVLAGAPPLLVAANTDVTFERITGATAYNHYVGRIGTWYDSDAGTGRQCAATSWIDNGDGTLTVSGLLPPVGSSWILVTAANACFEGSAGSDSLGRLRAGRPSWMACGPSP